MDIQTFLNIKAPNEYLMNNVKKKKYPSYQ